MIPHLEISIDTVRAERHLTDVQKRQIPFAIARTMNLAMNDAQEAVRGAAYGAVFTVRNRSLGKALTTIPNSERATKTRPRVTMMNVRDGRTGRMAGEGFIQRQIEGRTKKAKGSNIAIPKLGPGMRRLRGGSMPTAKKPLEMGDRLVKMRGGLYERQRRGLVKRYTLVPTARPSRRGRFRYYATGQKVIMRTVQGHWVTSMNRALATAR